MKLSLLKRKTYQAIVLVGLVTIVSVNEKTYCSAQVSTQAYQQLEQILNSCLFDRSNKKPFSYFIKQIFILVKQHTNQIEQHMPAATLKRFIIDLGNSLNINRSMQDKKKAAVKIGFIFKKYNKYLPPSFQQKTIAQMLAALRFRLSISECN